MVAVVRLRGFAWAGAMRRGAAAATAAAPPRGAAAASTAAAAAGGKVARFTYLECADVAKSSAFYGDASGLRVAPASSAARAVANDGLGLSCELVLLGAAGGAAGEAAPHPGAGGALDGLGLGDSEEEPLIRPFMTFGVSNLKTAARHAKRQFGAVGALRARARACVCVCGRRVCVVRPVLDRGIPTCAHRHIHSAADRPPTPPPAAAPRARAVQWRSRTRWRTTARASRRRPCSLTPTATGCAPCTCTAGRPW